MMECGGITHKKVHASPRPPPKIFSKDYWMKELDSEVAGGSEDSQQIQQKTKKSNCKNGETCEEVSNHPVRLLRKSTKVSCLTAKAPM